MALFQTFVFFSALLVSIQVQISALPVQRINTRIDAETFNRLFAGWSSGTLSSQSTNSSAGPSASGASGVGLGSLFGGVGASSAGGQNGGQAFGNGQTGLGGGKLSC